MGAGRIARLGILTLILSWAGVLAPAQERSYDVLLVESGYSIFTSVPGSAEVFRVNPDDTLTRLSALAGLPAEPPTFVVMGSRGNWAYVSASPMAEHSLLEVLPDSSLTYTPVLTEYRGAQFGTEWPAGDGVVLTLGMKQSNRGFIQPCRVTGESPWLVPEGVSRELTVANISDGFAVSHRGGGILFSQYEYFYRTYPFVDGNIGPPSEPSPIGPSPTSHWVQNVDISRDGRVIIVTCVGWAEKDPDAYSLWVGDDGTVTPVDGLLPESSDPSGFRESAIAPDRSWVALAGDEWLSAFRLNPDGSFGERLWRVDEMGDIYRISISGDGRLVAAGTVIYRPGPPGHLYLTTILTLVRVDEQGNLVSQFEHHFGNLYNNRRLYPAFIVRREPGDANGDGWIDVADLVTLINHVDLGTEIPNPIDLDNADVNRDGARNKIDIVTLVDRLLGR